ncbi:MAG: hypothetical protein WD669_02445 [Pirellulales bacterium]
MTRTTTCQPDVSDSLGCRFLPVGAAGENTFRHWLAADVRAARLSPAFRAYYLLRSLIPRTVRQWLQRSRRVETSPRWYFPDAFARALGEEVGSLADGLTTIHPWPDAADFALVLTHDVETAEGGQGVAKIADLEEELGFRSSWNFVPYKYRVDRGLVRDLTSRGFEIGVHGYNHDGRLFSSRAVFDSRVPPIQAALESWGAVGFRAPMVQRNLAWLQSLDILYDASCFDVDPYQAMPGGVGGVWPFIVGRFVELPYTLPQDHTLFIALDERDEQIWLRKLDYLIRLRGMALMLTHPDYLDSEDRIAAYRRFLCRARDVAGMWHALPKETAEWWRMRDKSSLRQDLDGNWRIEGPASGRARAATLRSVEVSSDRSDDSPPLALEWRELATKPKCLIA